VVKEDDEPDNCGHILWNGTHGFYEKVASDLAAFMHAKTQGTTKQWIKAYFDSSLSPYEMTDAEVAEGIVYRVSEGWISGVFRCPNCHRMHVHKKGTENQWESFVSEGRISGK
jgi:hypothetical protein